MKKQINIRFIYSISHQVMNVGENGTKTHKDPYFGVPYAYGSAYNIKRCNKEEFKDISDINSPVTVLEKMFNKKDIKEDNSFKENQGGVATQFDLSNPFSCLFGGWNATAEKCGDTKYAKASITSAVQFSEFKPLHPLLSYMTSDCIVFNGDENSILAVVDNESKKKYMSPKELAEGANITLQQAFDIFNNTRKMNFVSKDMTNKEANGIYALDVCINMDDIGRYNLTKNPELITPEEKENLIKNGMILKVIKGQEYLYFPKEFIKNYFKDLIIALFNWEFLSNVSYHASKPQLLRVAVTDSNVHAWHQSTYAMPSDEDDRKAQLMFTDNLENKGVYTFNTLLLNQFIKTDNASFDAFDNAIEKIVELGNKFIENM